MTHWYHRGTGMNGTASPASVLDGKSTGTRCKESVSDCAARFANPAEAVPVNGGRPGPNSGGSWCRANRVDWDETCGFCAAEQRSSRPASSRASTKIRQRQYVQFANSAHGSNLGTAVSLLW